MACTGYSVVKLCMGWPPPTDMKIDALQSGPLRPFEENAAVCSAGHRAQVCRGKRGFGARSTRNPYSVVEHPPGKRSSTDVPGNHTTKPTKRTQSQNRPRELTEPRIHPKPTEDFRGKERRLGSRVFMSRLHHTPGDSKDLLKAGLRRGKHWILDY